MYCESRYEFDSYDKLNIIEVPQLVIYPMKKVVVAYILVFRSALGCLCDFL